MREIAKTIVLQLVIKFLKYVRNKYITLSESRDLDYVPYREYLVSLRFGDTLDLMTDD
jgi:hypothetical protein